MKPNHLFALVAAAFAVLFFVLFAQQSGLEGEIAVLRGELKNARAMQAVASEFAQSTEIFTPAASDAARVGRPEPISDDELITAMRTRLADLEHVANGQADVLEDLAAEKARRDEVQRKASMRSWGPEQATGAPDTMAAGDRQSAWAPAVADGGIEWLEATFENPADLAKIVVRQTLNPGGITKIVAISDSGVEIPVWSGVDPGTGKELDDTPFAVPVGINANRVKVYIDTSKKAGWEEVDAMQIVGRDGSTQWAKSVNASSTYAGGTKNSLGRNLSF